MYPTGNDSIIPSIESPLQESASFIHTQTSERVNTCRSCDSSIAGDESYCVNCGFPVNGSEEEQNRFISNRHSMEMDLDVVNKKVKSAATTLYVLAALSFLAGIFMYNTMAVEDNPLAILIVYIILSAIYAGLALWTKKQALTAIISGLVLFIIVQLLSVADDPSNIFKGIIFKVIIIGYLIKGIRSATEAQRIKKQWNLQ